MLDPRAAECVSVDAVLARARTTWCLAGTLLAGCTPTPPEVSSTGLETSDAGSTGDASTGVPPGPTSEGSATMASADGTATGDGTSTGMPLDDGTSTGEPTTNGSSEGTVGSSEGDSTTGEPGECHPILAEVLHDAVGGNNNKQWVRLYNPCDAEIELADAYVLAYGGESYTIGQFELDGAIDPGECRVVGGPDSSNDNANPVWGQNVDFGPDLQLGGQVADGVALFVGTAADVMADTVPVDAVIYGDANESGLLDAEGAMPEPHVGNVGPGQSIRRTALAAEWEMAESPTPNECPELF
jgi:hypothetical protein